MTLENKYIEKFNIKVNYDTSSISWLKSGGIVTYFVTVKNYNQLVNLFKIINQKNLPHLIVGNFSNILIRSSGFNGILIKLSSEFTEIKILDNSILVGASVLDNFLARFCYNNSITGYEYLFTIPGTVGGNIFMNAGCYGNDISKNIKSINVFDTKTLSKEIVFVDQINFKYRRGYQKENKVILNAEMNLDYEEKTIIKKKIIEFDNLRKKTQPQKVNCCGSIFKNPPNKSAWELIRTSVDETYYYGEVKLSKTHSNFFENDKNISSEILENFLIDIEKKVFNKHQIKLERELRIIG